MDAALPPTTDVDAPVSATTAAKKPRTERGRRTMGAILDAAAYEFGEKGFHEASITGITQRAGVALGSFYTYFDSKDAVFRALVQHMSEQVRVHVAPAVQAAPDGLTAEHDSLLAFLHFARSHKEIYRIIDESEFVDPERFRAHYSGTADRIAARLRAAAERGEVSHEAGEIHAWAIMGMNVFLGMRYAVWNDDVAPEAIADTIGRLLRKGIGPDA